MTNELPEGWVRCEKCGEVYQEAGSWPFCKGGHGRPLSYHPFKPYFDIGLGREVTSLADRWRGMREQHLEYRDHPSKGDASAREDRCHAMRQARQARERA